MNIIFELIKDFKKFCKDNKVSPIINCSSKKHQNNKGQYLHELSGTYIVGNVECNFIIEECIGFNNKINNTLLLNKL